MGLDVLRKDLVVHEAQVPRVFGLREHRVAVTTGSEEVARGQAIGGRAIEGPPDALKEDLHGNDP